MALKDYIIKALLARGEQVVNHKFHDSRAKITRKFMVKRRDDGTLIHITSGNEGFYWVGNNGSIRVGAQMQKSIPLTPSNIVYLINEGKALEQVAKSS